MSTRSGCAARTCATHARVIASRLPRSREAGGALRGSFTISNATALAGKSASGNSWSTAPHTQRTVSALTSPIKRWWNGLSTTLRPAATASAAACRSKAMGGPLPSASHGSAPSPWMIRSIALSSLPPSAARPRVVTGHVVQSSSGSAIHPPRRTWPTRDASQE